MQKILEKYLPEKALGYCMAILQEHRIHLTITKHRVSKLGDYIPPKHKNEPHRISINGTLNPYSFLVTFVHEVAHALTWQIYRGNVPPHGREWKRHFRQLMDIFLKERIFPLPIHLALETHLANPMASSCRDEKLVEVLSQYDPRPRTQTLFLKDLPPDTLFTLSDDTDSKRLFQKKELLRKFFRCIELKSGKIYRVHSLAKVILHEQSEKFL